MFLEYFKDRKPDLNLKSGEILFMENEEARNAFIIQSGFIEIRVRGNELTTLGEDEIIGEMSLVSDSSRFAMAMAGPSGASLFSVDKKEFRAMIERDPDFAMAVMRVMAERLRKWGELFD